MARNDFLAPAVPGVTQPSGDGKSLFEALALTDSTGKERTEAQRAAALYDVARDWTDKSRWYQTEAQRCRAFYNGWQYCLYSAGQDRWILAPEPRANSMVRIVVNAIKPTTDMAAALLSRDEPIFGAAGAKSEVRDSAASEAGDAVLRDVWRAHKLASMYRDSARDVFVTGSQPILVEWDDSAGRPVPATKFDEALGVEVPDVGEDGKPKTRREGDLLFTYLDRAQVIPDPAARSDRDGEGITIVSRLSRARVRAIYPEKAALIDADTDQGSTQTAELDAANAADRASGVAADSVTSPGRDTDLLTVYRTYARSSAEWPMGREIHYTARVVLLEKDNPIYPQDSEPDETWPGPQWPVFTARCDTRTSSYWGSGRVVHMLEPQKTYNGTFSKAVQHIAVCANAKILLPAGMQAEWSDEVGQVFRYPRWYQPGSIQYVQPPELPAAYPTMLQLLKSELEYIAGINEATMGNQPSSESSGRQVIALQQANIGKLKPIKIDLDLTWSEIMRFALFLFRRHADMKRKILVVGENKEVEIKYLDGADLAAGTDVIVFNDTSLPSDPAQRIIALNTIFEKLGTIQDPAMRTLFLRLQRLHDFAGMLEKVNPDEVKALRLIRQIVNGEPWYSYEGDDPLTFKRELDGFIKTREFEMMVEREKTESGTGWSQIETYAKAAATYFTQLAASLIPVQPGGFVMPPTQPLPPPTMVPSVVEPPPPLPPGDLPEPVPGPSGDMQMPSPMDMGGMSAMPSQGALA